MIAGAEHNQNENEVNEVKDIYKHSETTGVDAEITGVDAILHEAGHDHYSHDPEEMKIEKDTKYNLSGKRNRSYSHLKTQDASNEWGEAHVNKGHIMESGVTPQMTMKEGLAIFGEDGHNTVKSEMTQLHYRDVMRPVTSAELLPSQNHESLAYLMFLKRKCCGKIKGRGVLMEVSNGAKSASMNQHLQQCPKSPCSCQQ